jgi:hypothetical protein
MKNFDMIHFKKSFIILLIASFLNLVFESQAYATETYMEYGVGFKTTCQSNIIVDGKNAKGCYQGYSLNLGYGINVFGEGYKNKGEMTPPLGFGKETHQTQSSGDSSGFLNHLNINGDGVLALLLAAAVLWGFYALIGYPLASRLDVGFNLELSQIDSIFENEEDRIIEKTPINGFGFSALFYPSQYLPLYGAVKSFLKNGELSNGDYAFIASRQISVGYMSPVSFGFFIEAKMEEESISSPSLDSFIKNDLNVITFKEGVPHLESVIYEIGYRHAF